MSGRMPSAGAIMARSRSFGTRHSAHADGPAAMATRAPALQRHVQLVVLGKKALPDFLQRGLVNSHSSLL